MFISSFWKELLEHLGVELNLSTAFHPPTDGQTERVNQVLEGYLRHYSSFQQDDWADLLPLAEHAYYTAMSESTKVTPVTETLLGREGDTLLGCACNPELPSGALVKRATTSQRRTIKGSAARKPGERPRGATTPSQRA